MCTHIIVPSHGALLPRVDQCPGRDVDGLGEERLVDVGVLGLELRRGRLELPVRLRVSPVIERLNVILLGLLSQLGTETTCQ